MARRRDGATIKRERIQEMHNILTSNGALPADLDHMTAVFEFQFGLSSRKIREYLGILEKVGFIRVEGNLIMSPVEGE
jgi:hypothetical protein